VDRLAARRVLGVGPTATVREIDAAFRTGVRRAHPDHGGDVATFRALVDARRLLQVPRESRAPAPLVVVPDSTLARQLLEGLLRYLNRSQRPRRVQ